MTRATAAQIGAIHALAKKAALDEDTRRDIIERETGKRSSAKLTTDEAGRVIDRLKLVAEGNPDPSETPAADGALRLSGPFAAICRAMWLNAYNLGVIDNRTDKALVAFVRRQTGIEHLNWLRDGEDAAKVLEALKAMINRTVFVNWDATKEMLRLRKMDLTRWRKLAVLDAQRRRLALVDPTRSAFGNDVSDRSDRELNAMMADLGRQLRAALHAREARKTKGD